MFGTGVGPAAGRRAVASRRSPASRRGPTRRRRSRPTRRLPSGSRACGQACTQARRSRCFPARVATCTTRSPSATSSIARRRSIPTASPSSTSRISLRRRWANSPTDRSPRTPARRPPGSTNSGVPVGGRVAVVSQNSARLYTSFFGVSGWGRVLVPINFRLSRAEIQYIVGHSGAEVVYADPALKDTLDTLDVEHKFVLGEDDALYLRGTEPKPSGPTRTRARPRRSTTRPAPPPVPRACSSPTATTGSTRRSSACTRRSAIATCTCTRCRCSTPTAGACRSA